MTGERLLDPARLADMRAAMDPASFVEAVAAFRDGHVRRLPRIADALGRGDYAALLEEVHDLKSTLGTFGLPAAAAYADMLTEAARREDGAACASLLPGLARTADAGMQALADWIVGA